VKRRPPNPWKLPALDELGAQFGRLEQEERTREAQHGPRPNRRSWLLIPSGAIAIVLAILLVSQKGELANALSIINRAPAAAVKSASVQFRSAITVTAGGRQIRGFSQTGEISFVTGDYRTTLDAAGTGTGLEWRSVDNVLYLAETQSPGHAGGRTRWIAVRLSRPQRAKLASAPESDALTDPLALLRVLANTRAPVALVGSASIGGVMTKQYRAVTDLVSLLKASSGADTPTAGLGAVTATINVWLDSLGRPRRVVEVLAGESARGATTLTTTINFTGYGKPTEVRPPSGVHPSPTLGGGPPQPLVGGPSRLFERLLLATRPPSGSG
jgi:hypothetical protein